MSAKFPRGGAGPFFARSLLYFEQTTNKGADQTAWIRRQACAFVVRMHKSQTFLRRGPF